MAADSLRGRFRNALRIALKAHFDAAGLPIDFEAGQISGPQSDRDIGCVWFDLKRMSAGRDANNEEALFGVRVLRRFRQEQGAGEERELTEDMLDWTFETLEDGLRAVINATELEAASGISLDGWESFFVVLQVAKNTQEQSVTASVQAWARNRTARGG